MRNQIFGQSPQKVHTLDFLLVDLHSDEDHPGQTQMNNVHINTVAQDADITNISVQLPHRQLISDKPLVPASMEVKVETRAQANVLPMR